MEMVWEASTEPGQAAQKGLLWKICRLESQNETNDSYTRANIRFFQVFVAVLNRFPKPTKAAGTRTP